jgi:hypothetical protein
MSWRAVRPSQFLLGANTSLVIRTQRDAYQIILFWDYIPFKVEKKNGYYFD